MKTKLDCIREVIIDLRRKDFWTSSVYSHVEMIEAILLDLVDHMEKSEQNVNRVSNEASCLANGIKPD